MTPSELSWNWVESAGVVRLPAQTGAKSPHLDDFLSQSAAPRSGGAVDAAGIGLWGLILLRTALRDHHDIAGLRAEKPALSGHAPGDLEHPKPGGVKQLAQLV